MMSIPVYSILLREINAINKKGSAYDIAKALLDRYHDIPNFTIHEMADACFVSSASLSRFVRSIGFESYSLFKEACEKEIGIEVDYSKDVSKARIEDMHPIIERYTNNIKDNISYTYQQMDFKQLERICHRMHEANEIAFFGLEFATLLGQHFQNKMTSMNKFVKLGLTYEDQLAIAKELHEDAFVIIPSLEGGYFYRNDAVLNILKEKHAHIITLTMHENTKLMKEVDEIIICNKENSNTEGRITLLYMIEILLMYYFVNYQMDV